MPSAAGFGIWLAVILLTAAALHDLALRTVPNGLVAALAGCAAALAVLQHRLLPSAAVAAVVLAVAALLWLRGHMGGADVKLLAASALLVAPASVPSMLLATVIAGGALCLPYLSGRRLLARPAPGRPADLLPRLLRCERWRLRRRGPLPYAVAIAAGTVFVLLQGA